MQQGVVLGPHERRQLDLKIAAAKMAVLQARQAKEECVAREDYATAEVPTHHHIYILKSVFSPPIIVVL